MSQLVDISRIQETSDGDLDFERELIGMYLDDAGNLVSALLAEQESRDLTNLKHLSHTLKGSSANIGATGLQNLSYMIEKQSISGAFDGLEGLLQELKECYDKTEKFFNDYLFGIG